MKKRSLSILLAALMILSICAIPDLRVEAEELSLSGAEEVIKISELGMEARISDAEAQTYDFADEMLSRAYQVKVEALGAELFPEYAQKAEAFSVQARARNAGNLELGNVVYSETKDVSDTEKLTYMEYSSGRAGYLYFKSWGSTSSDPDIGGTRYTRTLVITVAGCYGSVYVQGLVYSIYDYTYDAIINEGKCIGGNANFNVIDKAREDANGPAQVSYGGTVEDMLFSIPIGVQFSVRIGNNVAKVYDPSGTEI